MGDIDRGLKEAIEKEIKEAVPDIDAIKLSEVAQYLLSNEIGVRSVERLFDVGLDDLMRKLPSCDARRIHRTWQSKFKPTPTVAPRQQRALSLQTFNIDWNKFKSETLKLIDEGKVLPKKQRNDLINTLVDEVITAIPNVKRNFFMVVAQSLVHRSPGTFQDPGAEPLGHSFYAKKLACCFDEKRRPKRSKDAVEAPYIPEAYGCVKWRVANCENETDQSLQDKKEWLLSMFTHNTRRNWNWPTVLQYMEITYSLQRKDINSQVKPRSMPRRQQEQWNPKSTQEILDEWPFLFQSKGMSLHFKILTGVDFSAKVEAFKDEYKPDIFIEFLSRNCDPSDKIAKRRKRIQSREENQSNDLDMAAVTLLLVKHFKEDRNLFVQEVEKTTPINEVENEAQLPPTPCMISLGDVLRAQKYYFAVDGQLVSAAKNFKDAAMLLFCSYFVLNLKYPKGIENTLEFYQRVIADINPSKGSKRPNKTTRARSGDKLQTLLDKWAQYNRDGSESSNEEQVDDLDIVSE